MLEIFKRIVLFLLNEKWREGKVLALNQQKRKIKRPIFKNVHRAITCKTLPRQEKAHYIFASSMKSEITKIKLNKNLRAEILPQSSIM